MNIDIIPNDIVNFIFSKLRLRNLVRCKLVCKWWKSIIDFGESRYVNDVLVSEFPRLSKKSNITTFRNLHECSKIKRLCEIQITCVEGEAPCLMWMSRYSEIAILRERHLVHTWYRHLGTPCACITHVLKRCMCIPGTSVAMFLYERLADTYNNTMTSFIDTIRLMIGRFVIVNPNPIGITFEISNGSTITIIHEGEILSANGQQYVSANSHETVLESHFDIIEIIDPDIQLTNRLIERGLLQYISKFAPDLIILEDIRIQGDARLKLDAILFYAASVKGVDVIRFGGAYLGEKNMEYMTDIPKPDVDHVPVFVEDLRGEGVATRTAFNIDEIYELLTNLLPACENEKLAKRYRLSR